MLRSLNYLGLAFVLLCSVSFAGFDGFYDDFDSYQVGTFPSSQWIPNYNAKDQPQNNKVIVDPTNSDNQVLQLYSRHYWASVIYHSFDFDSSFMIKARMYQQQGNWPIIDLSQGANNSNYRRLFELNATTVTTLGRRPEAQGLMDQWNDLKIVYERENLDANIKFWLNGALIEDRDLDFISENHAFDVQYNYLSLVVGNYGSHYGYFDDICVGNDLTCPGGAVVPTPSALILAGIGLASVRLIRFKGK